MILVGSVHLENSEIKIVQYKIKSLKSTLFLI
jgi:hypothetical protein